MTGRISSAPSPLINDREVAHLLGVKPGTIRKQRCDRQNGRPHWFTVDSVKIGSSPRYFEEDVLKWRASRRPQGKSEARA